MERTRRSPGSRSASLSGRPPGGILPRLLFVSTCLLLPPGLVAAIGTAGAAVTAVSCTGETIFQDTVKEDRDTAAVPPPQDTLTIRLTAGRPVKTLDLLIYDHSWTRSLKWHGSFEYMPQELAIPGLSGDLIAVAIANSPAPLNAEALRSFDSAELLQMRYADEDPDCPLMSAVSAANGTAELHLLPLLCEVQVLSISNSIPGSPLAENVRISLTGVNASAEVLRFDGFRPVETVDSPAEVKHPSIMECRIPQPIGMYTVYPAIKLFCYPSDGPEAPGCPLPEIVLECTVAGESLCIIRPLPPIGRAETIKADLDIALF